MIYPHPILIIKAPILLRSFEPSMDVIHLVHSECSSDFVFGFLSWLGPARDADRTRR